VGVAGRVCVWVRVLQVNGVGVAARQRFCLVTHGFCALRLVVYRCFSLLTVLYDSQVPAVVRLFKDLQELVVEETSVEVLPDELAACSKLAVLSLTRSQVSCVYISFIGINSALSCVEHRCPPTVEHRYASWLTIALRYSSP